jgi:hypothetical protein
MEKNEEDSKMDFSDTPFNDAISAFEKEPHPSLSEKLLFAILGRVDKISRQIEAQEEGKETID